MSLETSFNSKQPKLEPKLVPDYRTKMFVLVVSLLYWNREFVFWLNRNKQKSNRNTSIESIFWYFFKKFRFVLVCLGLFWNSSVCFKFLFYTFGWKHQNKPKQIKNLCFGFTKQTKTQPKQILFRFVSVRTEIFFSFRGHPTLSPLTRSSPLSPSVSWCLMLTHSDSFGNFLRHIGLYLPLWLILCFPGIPGWQNQPHGQGLS